MDNAKPTVPDRKILEYVRAHPASFQLVGLARETGLSIPDALAAINDMVNRLWLTTNGRVYALTPTGQADIEQLINLA